MCGLLLKNTEEECPTKKFMTPVHLAFLHTITIILMRTIRKLKVSSWMRLELEIDIGF